MSRFPVPSIAEWLAARRARLALYGGFLIVAGFSSWFFAELRFALNVPYGAQAPLDALLAYEADRPFQYRILVPFLVNGIPGWLIEKPVARFFAIEFLATLGTVFAFRAWLRRFFSDDLLRSLLSLLIVPCMVYSFVLPRDTPLWFPWDIPSVLVFALGLLFLHEKRWWLFYPLFVLGTLNRETTCFLTIIFFLGHWDDRRTRAYWLHCMSQTLLWVAIKIVLMWAFQDRGGQVVYHHIGENWALLGRLSSYPLLLSSMGFTAVLVAAGYPLVRDPFVRRGLLCLVPFHVGLFLVGRLLETRIYGELIPLTLCATMLIVAGLSDPARRSEFVGSSPPGE